MATDVFLVMIIFI